LRLLHQVDCGICVPEKSRPGQYFARHGGHNNDPKVPHVPRALHIWVVLSLWKLEGFFLEPCLVGSR
jgi:hypothetical protein